jgi:transposase
MKYQVQDLVAAVTSSLSSIEASKRFKVPARTIRSHRQTPSQKYGSGRHRYLNDEQEDYFLSLIKLLINYKSKLTY